MDDTQQVSRQSTLKPLKHDEENNDNSELIEQFSEKTIPRSDCSVKSAVVTSTKGGSSRGEIESGDVGTEASSAFVYRIVRPDGDGSVGQVDASSTDDDSRHSAYTLVSASELSNGEGSVNLQGKLGGHFTHTESTEKAHYFPLRTKGAKPSDDRRTPTIEEPDSDLVHDAQAQLHHGYVDDQSHDAIAKTAIRGQQLSVPTPRPGITTEPSEITDGGEMYAKNRFDFDEISSDISDDPEHTLQERIFSELCRADSIHKGFLPRGILERLINEKVVVEWMTKALAKTYSPVAIQTYASKICPRSSKSRSGGDDSQVTPAKSYRKIFVILTLIEMEENICKFVDEGVNDDDLPLCSVESRAKPGMITLRRKRNLNAPLACFDGWRPMRRINFEEWQWVVLAPFFARGARKNVGHYVLKDKVILPFMRGGRQHKSPGEHFGGFGQVSRVYIHPDHHDFGDPTIFSQGFAIKSLNSTEKADFRNEVEMLNKFSDDAHPHLISLLATYEQRNKFYLIFQWANADLLQFWKTKTPKRDYESIVWMAKQCEGLANGLLKLHKYVSTYEEPQEQTNPTLGIPQHRRQDNSRDRKFGRHGDIKPANVLWFRDPHNSEDKGNLKISDFGLAEFRSQHSRSNRPNSNIAFSVSYRPPECDLKGAGISRSYDIWTLGCLYLEFIAWQLGGWTLVDQFSHARCDSDHGHIIADLPEDTFFEITHEPEGKSTAQVKRAVTEFIILLHSHENCTDFFHEFLNLIEYDMLVVEGSGSDTLRRMECQKVWRKLLKLRQECGKHQRFALQATRWKKGLPSVFVGNHNARPKDMISTSRAQESFSGREEQLVFQQRNFATM